jgi:hypothetical protein
MEEALLIGGDAPKQDAKSAIATPVEIVRLSVFGEFPDNTAVEQTLSLRLPRNVPEEQAVLFVWDQISKLGGLTIKGQQGEYNFYPLAVFKRLTLKFNQVVGVSLDPSATRPA